MLSIAFSRRFEAKSTRHILWIESMWLDSVGIVSEPIEASWSKSEHKLTKLTIIALSVIH